MFDMLGRRINMKVIRSNDFIFKGQVITDDGKTMLCFESRLYSEYLILVREAKYVDVSTNTVQFLKVEDAC